jgi:sodium/bile acid cotransporter 7
MGVPLINVLYQKGDPGTIGVLSTPLLLYHVEQLILGNIEVEILKKWVARGCEKDHFEENTDDDNSSDQQQTTSTRNRDEESAYDSGVTRIEQYHSKLKI